MSARQGGLTHRGEQRRAAVVRGAVELLAQEGLSALTHRRVAARVQVPLAATTYYFKSKDDLLVAALESIVGEEIERVSAAVLELLAGRPSRAQAAAEVAHVLAGILAEAPERRMAIFEVLLCFARRPDLRPVAERWLGVYEQLAADTLRALDVPDPEVRARTLIATVHGLMLRQLLAPAAGSQPELFTPALSAILGA